MRRILAVTFTVLIVGLLAGSAYAGSGVDEARLMQNLGYYAYENDDLAIAEALFARAIELDPAYEHVRNDLAVLLHEQERYSEASAQLERLVELDPQNVEYWYDLGVNRIADLRFGSQDPALFFSGLEAYERASELDDDYARVEENLAVLYRIREGADV